MARSTTLTKAHKLCEVLLDADIPYSVNPTRDPGHEGLEEKLTIFVKVPTDVGLTPSQIGLLADKGFALCFGEFVQDVKTYKAIRV